MKQPLIPLVGSAAALAFALGACSAANTSTSSRGASSAISATDVEVGSDSRSKAASTFANEVLTTPDLKIKITRAKVIGAGQKGNEYSDRPVIAFWYTTTNLSDAKISSRAFVMHFNAFQDNDPNAENSLDVGALPDDRFLDSQGEDIKPGGTVRDAVAYELDDLETPVDLVATQGFDDVIGKATYRLPKQQR